MQNNFWTIVKSLVFFFLPRFGALLSDVIRSYIVTAANYKGIVKKKEQNLTVNGLTDLLDSVRQKSLIQVGVLNAN